MGHYTKRVAKHICSATLFYLFLLLRGSFLAKNRSESILPLLHAEGAP